jgi:hypothetical protein
MPPPRLPADPHFAQVPVSQHGQQQEGHDVSLSGFLNDTHRREEDTNPFGVSAATYEEELRETPFDSQTAYPYSRALLGGEAAYEGSQPGLDGGEEAGEDDDEEGERVVYKSPPFMQVGLPEVEEDAVVPGREAETAEKEEGGLGLGIPGRTGREGGMGHVRAPTVVVNRYVVLFVHSFVRSTSPFSVFSSFVSLLFLFTVRVQFTSSLHCLSFEVPSSLHRTSFEFRGRGRFTPSFMFRFTSSFAFEFFGFGLFTSGPSLLSRHRSTPTRFRFPIPRVGRSSIPCVEPYPASCYGS